MAKTKRKIFGLLQDPYALATAIVDRVGVKPDGTAADAKASSMVVNEEGKDPLD